MGVFIGAPAIVVQDSLDRLQAHAQSLRDKARDKLNGRSIRWSTEDTVVSAGGLGSYVGLKSRFSDLVLLPSPYGVGAGPQDELILEAALFDGDAAMLVLPRTANRLPDFRKIVMAWNQSEEALHAARAALPLQRAADLVNVVVIDPPAQGLERSDPGGLLTTMLARHGVRGEVSVIASTSGDSAETLRRHALDKNADLLIIGAYSHSRLRQTILGGTTRSLLSDCEIPIFMMH
jgi:nucleotide-binding universal stress UspA family protein